MERHYKLHDLINKQYVVAVVSEVIEKSIQEAGLMPYATFERYFKS